LLVFRSMPDSPLELAAGLLIVAVGIALFLYGLDLSIFPVGKNLANQFVRSGALGFVAALWVCHWIRCLRRGAGGDGCRGAGPGSQ
jgi:hypothetical protein